MKYLLIIIALTYSLKAVSADTPQFENLTDGDFETISKEFSSLFIHTSVTPPTSLGKIFGVEAGVIAGAAEIPGVESISQRFDPSVDMPYAPFAMLFGSVSVPFGITAETNILPSMDVSGLELSHYGLAAKWSITDVFFSDLPFDIAVKTYYSQSKIGFNQTVTSPIATTVDVEFENSMVGAETLLGLDFMIVQPYIGGGFVRSSSELSAIANLDPTYSLYVDNSRSKKDDVSSFRLVAGCQFNLTILKLGLEYNRVFDTNRVALKTSFAF